jgi:hypothetical protein
MGPNGLVFAFGTVDAAHHYGLGALQSALVQGTGSQFGRAQGWTDANSVREIVRNAISGFDDIVAFGAAGVYVAMGQDPAAHAGQAFGQAYLALADMGANQGWSAATPRHVADVNGDGIVDLVGFGTDSTFTAFGSRDSSGNLHFTIDSTKTVHDFGKSEGWDGHTMRELADVTGAHHDSLVLSGASVTQVWDLA